MLVCISRPGLEFRGEAWDAQSMNGIFKREKPGMPI